MVRQNRVDYIRSSSLNREIALSTVLHVLVVLSAFIVLPTPEKISLPDYALPIDVITIDDFTRLTSQDPKPETKTDQAEEMSLSEIDAFRAQIRACWSVPAGAKNAESLVVRVRVQLDPSGRPIAKKVINRAQLTDSFFLSAAESVLRAIERCQPYKMPPEKYESWREMELNFDPSKMLNG